MVLLSIFLIIRGFLKLFILPKVNFNINKLLIKNIILMKIFK
jgi:hypothetical protein